jgi:DNA-binding MarR family transcriptional regulator
MAKQYDNAMPPSQPQRDAGPQDSVDRLLASWSATRPDLDLSPVAVIARLNRLRRIVDAELAATFAEYGLDGPDFAALVTLRRLDQPGGVTQRRLMRELNLSSGTVSVRIERLADRGLVSRATDPADRRNSLISLTKAGHALFDAVTPAHIATENRLLSALSDQQRGALVCLLRTLLVSFEGSADEGTFPRLGLTLAPAHHTLDARRAVGLPGLTGLLVRDVLRGSRAERAGLRPGDVLVRAAGSELRSITTLYAAINDAIGAGTLTMQIVRGEKTTREVAIDLRPQPGDDLPPGNTAPSAATAAHTL